MLVAVIGIPGAGKSSIYAKLKELGYDAWDTDADGLSEWRDRGTKAPVAEPADWHDPVETRAIEYRVRRDRVAELRDLARERTVYLCGSAGGEDKFWDLLDLVICVDVDGATLRQRMATRTTNDYGKAAHELASIIAANATWAGDYERLGAPDRRHAALGQCRGGSHSRRRDHCHRRRLRCVRSRTTRTKHRLDMARPPGRHGLRDSVGDV